MRFRNKTSPRVIGEIKGLVRWSGAVDLGEVLFGEMRGRCGLVVRGDAPSIAFFSGKVKMMRNSGKQIHEF